MKFRKGQTFVYCDSMPGTYYTLVEIYDGFPSYTFPEVDYPTFLVLSSNKGNRVTLTEWHLRHWLDVGKMRRVNRIRKWLRLP